MNNEISFLRVNRIHTIFIDQSPDNPIRSQLSLQKGRTKEEEQNLFMEEDSKPWTENEEEDEQLKWASLLLEIPTKCRLEIQVRCVSA